MNLLHSNDRRGQHPPSWYAATAHDAPARPMLKGEAKADVCIVGAGFTGLSAALHLAEAGLDPARIRTPALDDGFDLRPGEAPAHEPRPARLSHARAAAARDWHNAYARLLLDLGKRLETLDDDARRETLLDRLRKALREDER